MRVCRNPQTDKCRNGPIRHFHAWAKPDCSGLQPLEFLRHHLRDVLKCRFALAALNENQTFFLCYYGAKCRNMWMSVTATKESEERKS